METQNKQDHNDNTLARSRTWVSRVGGENSTTEPPMPPERTCLQWFPSRSSIQVFLNCRLRLRLFPGWSSFSFSALRGTSCPLPAEGCFGRQSGVLWLRLSAGTACCSCSLAQPCPTLCDPLDFSPPGPSVHGLARSFAGNPSRQCSCPLASCLAPRALQGAWCVLSGHGGEESFPVLGGWETQMGNAATGGAYSLKLSRTAVWLRSVGWLPYDNNA